MINNQANVALGWRFSEMSRATSSSARQNVTTVSVWEAMVPMCCEAVIVQVRAAQA
jgi:hypothetical protein